MALDIDDIVHSPRDLVMPVSVPVGPISSEVHPRIRTKVGVQELLVVTIYGPGYGGPGIADAKVP